MKSTRQNRVLIAGCGVIGVTALGVYYSVPMPLPAADATAEVVTEFAGRYANRILLDAWLQGIGSLLTVTFVVGLVHMAGAGARFWGHMTALAGTVILGISLLDAGFAIGVVQATVNRHAATALTCFDLTSAMSHVFLIAPSLFLPLGAVLWGSRLLPRGFSYAALVMGVAFEVFGLAGLFNSVAETLVILLLIGQEIWMLGASITLAFSRKPNTDLVTAALDC